VEPNRSFVDLEFRVVGFVSVENFCIVSLKFPLSNGRGTQLPPSEAGHPNWSLVVLGRDSEVQPAFWPISNSRC